MQNLCVLCGLPSIGEIICADCRALLPWNRNCCPRCAGPLDAPVTDGVTCADCQQKPPAFHAAAAPLCYEFPVDTALKALKFRGELCYAPAFAALAAPLVQRCFPDCDALVPVPLHRWRHALRGYNQSLEIARPLARLVSLPVRDLALRTRATKPQSGLGTRQRRANVRDAFALRGRHCGRFPLIVDDVMTTGATCDQLAKTLLKNGAEKVGVITVARA